MRNDNTPAPDYLGKLGVATREEDVIGQPRASLVLVHGMMNLADQRGRGRWQTSFQRVVGALNLTDRQPRAVI